MNKEEKKQLDLDVVQTLNQNGIFNYLQAGMVADIADEIQKSEFDSMKPFKDFPTDINSKLAEEIVFEYLTRHNMTNTIQCIVSETNRQVIPKLQPSGNIKSQLNVDGDGNYLRSVLDEYNQNKDQIFDVFHDSLISQINERISKLGQSKSKHRSSSSHRHRHHRKRGSESTQNDENEGDLE